MQYSTVNGQRVLPFPKGKGVCDMCGAETLAKCGETVMWHWAHKSKKDCDPWWENETEWHRNWKSQFPENFREVVFECPETGEKHRADIVTEKGMVLEIQNSPMNLEELRSREAFYKNLVWVVNGKKFKSGFNIWKAPLPDPQCPDFDDVVFMHSQYKPSCSMFWRKSEHPEALHNKGVMVQIHSAREIEKEINDNYIGHHSFHWVRPHVAWLEAKCPVLIDFGDEILWRIENYKNRFLCVRAIAREKVIHDIKTEKNVTDIASRFYALADVQTKVAIT
jgi:hypothetical protein